jgi:dienelactone hydrolase
VNDSRWNLEEFSQPPATYTAPGLEVEGLRALFFEGPLWRGKPTRAFAYLGLPENAETGKVPGIVLVHGGDGTAFAAWVKLWTGRGYAAIAMDTCGNVPLDDPNDKTRSIPRPQRHEWGGPAGWGGFDQMDEPERDQWPYHAVGNVLLAHSLLRAQPEVDPERIGITGISWGGFLACISGGIDPRFCFAASVYGCGFLEEDPWFASEFERMGKVMAAAWTARWDPQHYLPQARMPFLWVTGTNDFAFSLRTLQKSYRLPSGSRNLSIQVRLPHGHGGPGENPEEIPAFADSVVNTKDPLTQILHHQLEDDHLRVSFQSARRITKAELNFTKDSGNWSERLWETLPVEINEPSCEIRARVPQDAIVLYLNLIDEDGLIISGEHIERLPGQ